LKKFSVTDRWICCRYFTQGDLEATNPSSLQHQQQAESKKLSQLHWNDKLKKFSVTDRWIGCRYFTQGELEGNEPEQLAAAAAGGEQEAVTAALE
jgi:hypothetical protein